MAYGCTAHGSAWQRKATTVLWNYMLKELHLEIVNISSATIMTTNTITTSWTTMTTRTNRKDMTMTNTNLVEFKTIYPDIERYLAEDCYVPNEV